MSMKINTRANSKAPQTPKSNKKKLFLLFTGSFLVFFFLCTFVASLITPSIDVPALKEGGEPSGVSSEDFKGRIDPRLKSIEMQEETGPVSAQAGNRPKSKNDITGNATTTNGETSVDLPNSAVNTNEDLDNVQSLDDVPYDNGKTPPTAANPFQPKKPAPKSNIKAPVANQISKPSNPKGNLMLREKIDQDNEPVTMNKVSVGNYSTPDEAKRVSQELMKSNLNVTPFIKEHNGSYSLQVGSFSSQEKAEGLASELRKRNISARISQD
jgi:hypothetical protein